MPYQTPGVYVEEISTLPPSVAEVATAIPAFIGYTQKGASGTVEIAAISTMLEYEVRFGGPKAAGYTVATRDGAIDSINRDDTPYFLYEALSLYFNNGGGRCYIVSVDNHEQKSLDVARFLAGLAELERHDEPTLIVMPEAVNLGSTDFMSLTQAALAQCKKLQDRFAILDVPNGDVATFRDSSTGTYALDYGAAYHPYLQTALIHSYDPATVTVGEGEGASALSSLKDTNTGRYNAIKKALGKERMILPPSAAIAGVYARTDRDHGVWKAPANVSLSSVIGPTQRLTAEEQAGLNVDPTSGKSINAIRAFTGKGTLVWGARTLAGNDNEWRYVSVRRLFIMIEESTKKASAFAVFEPNDAGTWLKVKGMIEAFLYDLWERGALQGSDANQAYFVNVGLGTTMTSQDVLEGRMNVEIGVAAVRPAEFIILRFSHKLAEA